MRRWNDEDGEEMTESGASTNTTLLVETSTDEFYFQSNDGLYVSVNDWFLTVHDVKNDEQLGGVNRMGVMAWRFGVELPDEDENN